MMMKALLERFFGIVHAAIIKNEEEKAYLLEVLY